MHRIDGTKIRLGSLSLDELIIVEGHCIERAETALAALQLVTLYKEWRQEEPA